MYHLSITLLHHHSMEVRRHSRGGGTWGQGWQGWGKGVGGLGVPRGRAANSHKQSKVHITHYPRCTTPTCEYMYSARNPGLHLPLLLTVQDMDSQLHSNPTTLPPPTPPTPPDNPITTSPNPIGHNPNPNTNPLPQPFPSPIAGLPAASGCAARGAWCVGYSCLHTGLLKLAHRQVKIIPTQPLTGRPHPNPY